MSKAKDRARAQSGIIFRDGRLVNKEEWYAAHPTRETLLQGRAEVRKAAVKIIEAKPTAEINAAAGARPFDYFCTKCERTHKHGSKVHEAHQKFASQ